MEKIITTCLLLSIVISTSQSSDIHRRKRETADKTECPECNEVQIPKAFVQEMSKFTDYSDFVHNMIELESIDPRDDIYLLANGSSDSMKYTERSVAVRPKPAGCEPDTTVVSLRPDEENDPTIIYFPSCTRVKRCGGCCSHKLLSCQPTEIQTLTFEVVKSQYTGGTKLKYIGKEIMPIDEHLKCKCDCRIREEDCNKTFQKYDKSQCKCYCTNIDDQHKCLQDRATKIWDSSSCTCRCRENKECQTGFFFDQQNCECISNPVQEQQKPIPTAIPVRNVADRRRYYVTPTIINPDDSSFYTTV